MPAYFSLDRQKEIKNLLEPGDCILVDRIISFPGFDLAVPGAAKHVSLYIGNPNSVGAPYGFFNLTTGKNMIIDVVDYKYTFVDIDEIFNDTKYMIIARHPDPIKKNDAIKRALEYVVSGHFYSFFNPEKSYCFNFIEKCFTGELPPYYIFGYPFILFPSFKNFDLTVINNDTKKKIKIMS